MLRYVKTCPVRLYNGEAKERTYPCEHECHKLDYGGKMVDFKRIEFEVKNMGIMSWMMKGKKKTQIKFNPVANQPSQRHSTDLEYEGGCKNLHI